MDWQTGFNALVAVASLLGGAMLKTIYDAIKELRDQDEKLHARISDMPNVYMRRDDFLNFGSEIKATLIRIENKLDGKADK